MQRLLLLPILLAILNLRSTDALCDLKNATHAICTDLDDAIFIRANNLITLSAPFLKATLKPDYFANLTDLRHLDLSGGSIQHIEPGTFNKLSDLHSLNLAENSIEYLQLGSFDGLNHLHALNLRKNKLQQLPPALARLKILKHVEVHGNPLQCNCATLRVRDLLLKRGLKFSGKKILCSGPKNLKGSSLFKLDSTTICNFEQQDREMQNDDAFAESTEEDIGSGDASTTEFLSTSESSNAAESSPFPSSASASASASVTPEALDGSTNEEPTIATESTSRSAEKEEEIFFDAEERKSPRKKVFKDALFYPVEGSGEDEGSGEGSGIGLGFGLGEWTNIGKVSPDEKEEESSSSSGFFESFFSGLWGPTESSTPTEEPNLAEEEFIDVSPPKEDEESIVPNGILESDEDPSTASESSAKIQQTTVATLTISNGVEIGPHGLNDDNGELGKVQANEAEKSNDALEVLPSAKQSKKGMGSYVVLAALLAILATLIGFAAYKGEFCKKKRKRGDPENGTEMRDMQKALLESGNSSHAQPKIASNGNVESVPLFTDTVDRSETKVTAEIPNASYGNTEKAEDAIKPARGETMQSAEENTRGDEDENFAKDDSLSAACRTGFDAAVNNSSIARLAEANGPPLSPGAQRVKITLQENPDSVPRTPILITRTMAGDNLVKLP